MTTSQWKELYSFCNYTIAELQSKVQQIGQSSMITAQEKNDRQTAIRELIKEKENASTTTTRSTHG